MHMYRCRLLSSINVVHVLKQEYWVNCCPSQFMLFDFDLLTCLCAFWDHNLESDIGQRFGNDVLSNNIPK